jgi:hypothetical protein
MIKIVLFIAVFIIVLFFYLHLQYHLKINNDINVFEVSEISKSELQKAHDLRSPYLFSHSATEKLILPEDTCKMIHLENYKNTKTFLPIDVTQSECNTLLTQKKYVRFHRNCEFMTKQIKEANKRGLAMLKPYGFANENINLVENNKDGTWNQKMRSERNYIIVQQNGTLVRLANELTQQDYEYVEDHGNQNYYLDTNIWNMESKNKHLELELHKGTILHVPKGWFISVKGAPIVTVHYDSPMSMLSRAHEYILYFMQKTNTTTIPNEAKRIELQDGDKSIKNVE